jgi:putative transcription factor
MCGSDVPRAEAILIDGVELSVCPRCTRFGTAEKEEAPKPRSDSVSRAMERRRRRMRTRDIYANQPDVLVADYSQRIRDARTRRRLKQEDLAKAINEKHSVVNKLEKGEMRPDDALVAKLERTLGIELRESPQDLRTTAKSSSVKGLTIGDLLKREGE